MTHTNREESQNGLSGEQLRDALRQIAEIATAATNGSGDPYEYGGGDEGSDPALQDDVPGCTIKTLPRRLLVAAAKTARTINPSNAPVLGPLAAVGSGFHVSEPLQIAVLTSKYWGTAPRRLTVSFMEPTPSDLRARIISHLNAWNTTAGISFVETAGTGQVRISREGMGYWSYLGTDILHIPRNRPTMNLQGFTMKTRESEYRRVVRHEAGHTLGFPHEHMRRDLVARIDRERAYEYFWETNGWDRATVDSQVLTPLSEASLMSTPADQDSIMCYQLPSRITTDRRPIRGGEDINQSDYAFAGRIYPKPGHATMRQAATETNGHLASEDGPWDQSEDVLDVAID